MSYRMAGERDIPVLCQLRKRQLMDEGIDPNIDIDEELYRFFADKLADGSLVQWLLEKDGAVIATAAILFLELPPTFTNRTGGRGYITNMYTAPEHRGKGIAVRMLEKLMDEARQRSVPTIILKASGSGRPVYKKFGFSEAGDWMELVLSGESL